MNTNLPELTEVLDEIEFFEREPTDRQFVELAIRSTTAVWVSRKVKRAPMFPFLTDPCRGFEMGPEVRLVNEGGRLAASRRPAGKSY